MVTVLSTFSCPLHLHLRQQHQPPFRTCHLVTCSSFPPLIPNHGSTQNLHNPWEAAITKGMMMMRGVSLTLGFCGLLCFGWSPCWDLAAFSDSTGRVVGAAHAAGLLQMPPSKLNNKYFLVRSGESEFDIRGIINTNPVAKTSIDNGLSTEGRKQAYKAALQLKEMGTCEGSCWIWASITQRSYQEAEIIAAVNDIDHSRIVPEYSFLDARGLGAYEGKELRFLDEVYKNDSANVNVRPPPFTDGTPNESVADVLVRVTQLMSILETQYSGENIIIIAPDSDNLSILLSALLGLDLRRHSDLAFAIGEVRHVDIRDNPIQRPPVSGLIKYYK